MASAAALLPYEQAHPEHFGNAQVVVPVGSTLLATVLTGLMGYIRIRQRQYLRACASILRYIILWTNSVQVTECG